MQAIRQKQLSRDFFIFINGITYHFYFSDLRPFAGMTSAQNIDLNQVRSVLDQTMSMSNCQERLKILLQAEEAQMKRDIRAFDMTQVEFYLSIPPEV